MFDAVIYIDGACQPNPGRGSYGYLILTKTMEIEGNGYIGKSTCNIAEYAGLIQALTHAKELAIDSILIKSDSKLVVEQMNGNYHVWKPHLYRLYCIAKRLISYFGVVKLQHIHREHNRKADAICADALRYKENIGPPVNEIYAELWDELKIPRKQGLLAL
mgnify:CR=1 FL=1